METYTARGWIQLVALANTRYSLHVSILQGPLARCLFISWLIGFIDISDVRNQGIIWVWVCQQGADRQQNFADRQSRAPLLFENIQADTSVTIDIGMINFGTEIDLHLNQLPALAGIRKPKQTSSSNKQYFHPKESASMSHLWGFEWIVWWKVDNDHKDSTSVRTVHWPALTPIQNWTHSRHTAVDMIDPMVCFEVVQYIRYTRARRTNWRTVRPQVVSRPHPIMVACQ